ncbi:MAG: Coenzyme F420 hydrogenase/dehydrogenase, beta subunit C-terminal domain [Oscillospiraceae bacterium]|nr:Coenzyme F420 hydrogenase/dehydrogenase, beta subunit C-terminal domain [Oscillospiraceae bacterium]
MINITEKNKCTGCHACAAVCPKSCIDMRRDSEGFLYPVVNTDECINCNKCERVCPILTGRTENTDSQQLGYAAYSKDEEMRLKSSSGGIFSEIAEVIIDRGGVVFGAAMAEDQRSVHHIAVDDKEGLEILRGSKYLQSTVGDTYKQAKEYLENGRYVLFTGTPCQIGGLYAYLGKDHDRLYTQDLICHGAPSPLVWEKYVEYREKKASDGSSPKVMTRRTFFRVKPWKRFSVRFEFSNLTEYLADLRSDPFMRGFLSDIYLRPSCYDCKYKTVHRQADITLADFWGIQNVYPDMDDDNGISFVWVHSDKGRELFDEIRGHLVTRECDTGIVTSKYNPAAVRSSSLPGKRKLFFDNMDKTDVADNIRICTAVPFIRRLYRKLRSVAGKCYRAVFKR